jgi:hypothetical protein
VADEADDHEDAEIAHRAVGGVGPEEGEDPAAEIGPRNHQQTHPERRQGQVEDQQHPGESGETDGAAGRRGS